MLRIDQTEVFPLKRFWGVSTESPGRVKGTGGIMTRGILFPVHCDPLVESYDLLQLCGELGLVDTVAR